MKNWLNEIVDVYEVDILAPIFLSVFMLVSIVIGIYLQVRTRFDWTVQAASVLCGGVDVGRPPT